MSAGIERRPRARPVPARGGVAGRAPLGGVATWLTAAAGFVWAAPREGCAAARGGPDVAALAALAAVAAAKPRGTITAIRLVTASRVMALGMVSSLVGKEPGSGPTPSLEAAVTDLSLIGHRPCGLL